MIILHRNETVNENWVCETEAMSIVFFQLDLVQVFNTEGFSVSLTTKVGIIQVTEKLKAVETYVNIKSLCGMLN